MEQQEGKSRVPMAQVAIGVFEDGSISLAHPDNVVFTLQILARAIDLIAGQKVSEKERPNIMQAQMGDVIQFGRAS